MAMLCQDIFATVLVQAEARNRKHLAGVMDASQWVFGICTTSISVTALQGHDLALKIVVLVLVSMANYGGTLLGTMIGKRFVHDDQEVDLEARVQQLEAHVWRTP